MTLSQTAEQITATLDAEGVPAFSTAGYERAQALLTEHAPGLSTLQVKTLAGRINARR